MAMKGRFIASIIMRVFQPRGNFSIEYRQDTNCELFANGESCCREAYLSIVYALSRKKVGFLHPSI